MKNPDLIDEQQYPDFWQQLENFKKFSKDVGQTAIQHQSVFVSSDEKTHRMTTCIQCPEFNKEQKRCYKCGCHMEHKIKFTAAKCPLNKW